MVARGAVGPARPALRRRRPSSERCFSCTSISFGALESRCYAPFALRSANPRRGLYACSRASFGLTRARVATLLALAIALLAVGGSEAALRSFSARFSGNLKGNFVFVGNTLMTCPGAVAACPGARDATGGTLNNNSFDMTYVDADADAGTFDSSSGDLSLAASSTIVFAGLYWGADTSAGTNGVAAPAAAQAGSVLLTPPGGSQTSVTASQLDTSGTRYQGFADVTSIVDSAGNGTYTLANVQAGTGQDRYAGWSLVVVYSNTAETTRNVTVFDGFQIVNAGNPTITIPVSGFITPPSGTVDTALGVLAYEGDRGLVGDSLQLGPNLGSLTTMTDAQNPTTNFFNSTISRLGTLTTTKAPNYVNQLGFDTDVVDAAGVLPNSATDAVMRLTTGGETYFPGVVVFATQLFAPDLLTTIAKTVTDVNGGSVQPGDALEYTVSFTNTGTDSATNVVLRDPIPASTTYLPGSLEITSGANSGAKTDATGDDQAELDSGSNQVVFRLGAGADATNGGVIAPAESTTIRFRVTVDAGTPDGTSVANTASLDYNALTLGTAYNGPSPTATVTVVDQADLSITKVASRSSYVAGSSLTYTITVSNGGPADVSGATVTDTVPAALSSFTWTCAPGCSPSSGTGSVSTAVTIASGASATVTLQGNVPGGTSGTLTNTASVAALAGVVDPNAANNTATSAIPKGSAPPPSSPPSTPPPTAPSADVAITKTAVGSANVGGIVEFSLVAHNAGPDAAANVVVQDTLPSELAFVSASGSCSATGQSVECTVASLPASADVTFTIRARVAGGAGGSVTNVATIGASTADPKSGNNTASAAVAIGSPPPPPPTTLPSAHKTKLALAKRWLAKQVRAGGTASVSIVVRNTGSATAKDVEVCDRGSTKLTFVSAPRAYYRNGSACWLVRRLRPGQTRSFSVTVRVDRTAKGRRIVNVSTATASNVAEVAPARATIRLKPARGAGRPGGVTG